MEDSTKINLLYSSTTPTFKFDPALATFTAGMAKRNSAAPFAAGVMVQGSRNLPASDTLIVQAGTQINGAFYNTADTNQASIVFWITPEWNGNDGIARNIVSFVLGYDKWAVTKTAANKLGMFDGNYAVRMSTDISSWVAGTTYCVVFRWDSKNTLDGTSYWCISINDVHAFGGTAAGGMYTMPYQLAIGTGLSNLLAPEAIIEGLTIYRRPLFDGTYGQDIGNGDEINLIYNAGTGKDPTEITGSWDVCFCLPTNATAGALVTGTGEAWSHPHSSNLLGEGFFGNGFYGGGNYSVKTYASGGITCSSASSLDNLANSDFTAECWVKQNTLDASAQYLFDKRVGTTSSGWRMYLDPSGAYIQGMIHLTTTDATAKTSTGIGSGKWSHVALNFNATTKIARIYIDGKLGATSPAGSGSPIDDASGLLILANNNGKLTYGWTRISNSIRYTTDFIPSRLPPAPDANTVGQWNMSEGSGSVVDNVGTSGSLADGTITAGSWVKSWVDEGNVATNNTSLDSNGTSTLINCGSGSTLDNLADNAFTPELWVRRDSGGQSSNGHIFEKTANTATGWRVYGDGTNIYSIVYCATTNAVATYALKPDGKWHHIASTFDDAGDRKVRIWVDGVLATTSTAGVGAIVVDASNTLYITNRHLAGASFDGAFGWSRISNSIRYTTTFTPPSRFTPPAIDANTMGQWNMLEGSGSTVADASGNGNTGNITAGTWLNTRDLAIDEAGSQLFAGGHIYYTPVSGSGIKQTFTGLTAGADYVIRALSFTESPYSGRPKIVIRDETNGVDFKELKGNWQYEIAQNGNFNTDTVWSKGTGWTIDTSASKAHCDGSQTTNSNITLSVGTMLNGGLVLNKLYKTVFTISNYSAGTVKLRIGSDGIGTIRSVDGIYTEYIRCVGATLDFDIRADLDFIGDIDNVSVTYIPESNHPDHMICSFELPTTARSGSVVAPADCTSISVKLLSDAEGVVGWHTCELLPNLIDNPSFDTGAVADPWIPDGWTNSSLVAGESSAETAIASSSGNSIKIIGSNTHYMYSNSFGVWNKFYCIGGKIKAISGTETVRSYNGRFNYNASNSLFELNGTLQYFKSLLGVSRVREAGGDVFIIGYGSGNAYFDDFYSFLLDDISLTATPATLANSIEGSGSGIRVDGLDNLYMANNGKLTATKGKIKFKFTPRHNKNMTSKFGNSSISIFRINVGSRYISLISGDATNLSGEHYNGTTWVGGTYNTTSFVAGNTYEIEVKYTPTSLTVKLDGVIVINATGTINLGGTPTNIYFGNLVATYQADGVISAP